MFSSSIVVQAAPFPIPALPVVATMQSSTATTRPLVAAAPCAGALGSHRGLHEAWQRITPDLPAYSAVKRDRATPDPQHHARGSE